MDILLAGGGNGETLGISSIIVTYGISSPTKQPTTLPTPSPLLVDQVTDDPSRAPTLTPILNIFSSTEVPYAAETSHSSGSRLNQAILYGVIAAVGCLCICMIFVYLRVSKKKDVIKDAYVVGQNYMKLQGNDINIADDTQISVKGAAQQMELSGHMNEENDEDDVKSAHVIDTRDGVGMDVKLDFMSWDHNGVLQWILSLKQGTFMEYKDVLMKRIVEKNVSGSDLIQVNMEDIRDWGIDKFDHVIMLHTQIKALTNLEGK